MNKKEVRVYEKPLVKKAKSMTFTIKLVNSNSKKLACRQCSSCHGCR